MCTDKGWFLEALKVTIVQARLPGEAKPLSGQGDQKGCGEGASSLWPLVWLQMVGFY